MSSPELEPSLKGSSIESRRAIAKRSILSVGLQRQLARQSDSQVLFHLARNKELDPEVQLILTRAPSSRVRRALASNRSITEVTQQVLARDAAPGVRSHLHDNPVFELDESFTVQFLRGFQRGQRFLDHALRELDPATRAGLEPDWSGTLGELLAACDALGPD